MDNASQRMLALLGGYWYSQALFVMAGLGLADRLAAGPQPSDALADAAGCDRAALYRFLRALSSAGRCASSTIASSL